MIGGHLAYIPDAATNALTAGVLPGTDAWIGYSDQLVEGTWTWSSGGSATYTSWAAGEPNDSGGIEDCAHMYLGGLWNDASCTDGRPYVCYVP